jgi:ABC-type cobalamin transport system ATPase subunit
MLLLAQMFVFLAAFAGVVTGSLGAIYFAGGAMNRAAGAELRRQRAVLAALCVCGIVASAALGFVAILALMYLASR